MDKPTARSRYDTLKTRREPYVNAAREASRLTIPSVFPETTNQPGNAPARIPSPWTNIGQRGVNNLASKLQLALFPPNSPFFSLSLDESKVEDNEQITDKVRAEIGRKLANIETRTVRLLETTVFRPVTFDGLRQLIIGGNTCLNIEADSSFRMYRLDNYVVARSGGGKPIEVITHEVVAVAALPDAIREAVIEKTKDDASPKKPDDEVSVYTWAVLKGDTWHRHQEVLDMVVESTRSTHKAEEPPLIPLRFISVAGEDYGRGYVEELIGDLRTANSVTRSITLAAAEAAKVIRLIRPGSSVRPDDLTKDTGHVGYGRAEDITSPELGKIGDFQFAARTADLAERRLEHAFLLTTPRDAERVTAEEIRLLARNLEDSLGGAYSVLSQDFQRPLIRRFLRVQDKAGNLPPLPLDFLDLRIVTGIEALGRGHEQDRLDALVSRIAELFGPEAVAMYLKDVEYIETVKSNLGVVTDVIRSAEEVAQIRQAQQQQAMMQQATPELLRQGGAAMREQAAREAP